MQRGDCKDDVEHSLINVLYAVSAFPLKSHRSERKYKRFSVGLSAAKAYSNIMAPERRSRP